MPVLLHIDTMNIVLEDPLAGAAREQPRKRPLQHPRSACKAQRRRKALGDITNHDHTNTNANQQPEKKPANPTPAMPKVGVAKALPKPQMHPRMKATKIAELEDPQMVAAYAPFIDVYMRGLETNYPMGEIKFSDGEVTPGMRSILVDWLVQVHQQFSLHQETLYLCVAIVDRYMAKKTVKRKELQLLGVTGLFLAAKYEEIYPPDIGRVYFRCPIFFS